MAKDSKISEMDLLENPTARVPVCLVLDCSPSMSGQTCFGSMTEQTDPRPIDALNEGVKALFNELLSDEVARFSAEIAIVAFSGVAEKIADFGPLSDEPPPVVSLDMVNGGTSLGTALTLALTLLDERKASYKNAGVDYYQPWLVVLTDGQPTDTTHVSASQEVSRRVNARGLSVFPIAVGEGADMSVLASLSPKRPPLTLKGLEFKAFFEWLSKSVSAVSQSVPGEKVKLDQEGIKGWAEL